MTNQSYDLVVAGGALLYVADSLVTNFPANTVAYGASWGAGWTPLGYTKEPTKVSYSAETVDIEVEQAMSAVRKFKVSEKAMIETTLAELTGQSLKYALDASLTTVAAASGIPGSETIDLGGDTAMTMRRWGVEGLFVDANGNKLPIRVFMYRGVVTPDTALELARKDTTGVKLVVEAMAQTANDIGEQLIQIVKITAPALA